jgi:hypothetical protein
MTTHTTKQTTKAERDFNAFVESWKARGLKVVVEDKSDDVLGRMINATVKARRDSVTVYITATLRTPITRIARFRRRTSLKFSWLLFVGSKTRRADLWTANWYLSDICKEIQRDSAECVATA